jgi:hypothetical protein
MLTIFSTPKPFLGHAGIIQRNALRSWTLLHPGAEVILFGNEEGAAEVCQELGIRHEPDVRRNENGTKYLNCMFERAYEMSRNKFLCYVNCDIMLISDFCEALQATSKAHDYFLSGIPVVSTPVLSVVEFSDIVYIADTAREFVRAIEAALAEPLTSPKGRLRIEAARDHSTEALGARLEETLNFDGQTS